MDSMTKDTWLYTSTHNAKWAYEGRHNPQFPMCWWINKEIRIFWEKGVPEAVARLIEGACRDRLRECELPGMEFQLWGSHSSVMEQIQRALTNNDEIDDELLADTCLKESWRDESNGGRQHADIIITRHPLINDHASWASASALKGVITFALHSDRIDDHDFLRRVAKHEMAHMLGLMWHCNEHKNVEGYDYNPQCNLHWECSGEHLCLKCRDFIFWWWEQFKYLSSQ